MRYSKEMEIEEFEVEGNGGQWIIGTAVFDIEAHDGDRDCGEGAIQIESLELIHVMVGALKITRDMLVKVAGETAISAIEDKHVDHGYDALEAA